MKIDDIRIQAQTMIGTPLDKSTVYVWITDQINKLVEEHPRAGKYIKEKFKTIEKFEDYIPERKIVLLDKIIDQNRNFITDFESFGDEITMSEPGEYEIRYWTYPDKPQTEDDEIDMPLPYLHALKFYVSARLRARVFTQTDPDAISFYQEYSDALKEADVMMDRKMNKHRRIPPMRRGM